MSNWCLFIQLCIQYFLKIVFYVDQRIEVFAAKILQRLEWVKTEDAISGKYGDGAAHNTTSKLQQFLSDSRRDMRPGIILIEHDTLSIS